MNNLSSYFGLVDAGISASDKDLPVLTFLFPRIVKNGHITLESGIDVGKEINIGKIKFGKKNKHRALNKRRTSKLIFLIHFYIKLGIMVIF
jgi:hypothetical protein